LTAHIHPTALVSAEVELAHDVEIGAFAILEGPIRLGSGCVIHPRARLVGPLVIGEENQIFDGAVIGGAPQHRSDRGEAGRVEVGDRNTFREHVTVHRGTAATGLTRIGNQNYLMAGAHVGHDCRLGDGCTLVNNALLGGHCEMSDGAYVSGNSAIHQFCRVGRLALVSGTSISTKDVPPFVVQQGANAVAGVNVIGMRRAGLSAAQIDAVRAIYRIFFLQGLGMPAALCRAEEQFGTVDVVREFIAFVRSSTRGINRVRRE
jgi:UDP-N-acetylglucosamine acyltransferase